MKAELTEKLVVKVNLLKKQMGHGRERNSSPIKGSSWSVSLEEGRISGPGARVFNAISSVRLRQNGVVFNLAREGGVKINSRTAKGLSFVENAE